MDAAKSGGSAETTWPRTTSEADEAAYTSNTFVIECFKVIECSVRRKHEWTSCPFAHPGEKATRRSLRHFKYKAMMCGDMQQRASCPRGDSCHMCHNIFELWLHPMKHRTTMCKDGDKCPRISGGGVCFFAHSQSELRQPTDTLPPLDDNCTQLQSPTAAGAACSAPQASSLPAVIYAPAANSIADSVVLGLLPYQGSYQSSANMNGSLSSPLLIGGSVMEGPVMNGAVQVASSSCSSCSSSNCVMLQPVSPIPEQQQSILMTSSSLSPSSMVSCSSVQSTWPAVKVIGSAAAVSECMTLGATGAAMLQPQPQQQPPVLGNHMKVISPTVNRPLLQLQQSSFQQPASSVTDMVNGLALEASKLSADAAAAQAKADAAQSKLEAWISAVGLGPAAAAAADQPAAASAVSRLSPLEAAPLLGQQAAVMVAAGTTEATQNTPGSMAMGSQAAIGLQAAAACSAAEMFNVSGGAYINLGQVCLAGDRLISQPSVLLAPTTVSTPSAAAAAAAAGHWQLQAPTMVQLQQQAGYSMPQLVQVPFSALLPF